MNIEIIDNLPILSVNIEHNGNRSFFKNLLLIIKVPGTFHKKEGACALFWASNEI
jgi:hypothetical protein